ncbi:hypothetical protein FMM74_021535 [Lachnospiraceae bacterium MD308]|nr:hypothetical protein [Lachnospiraceae bacterium MD308]
MSNIKKVTSFTHHTTAEGSRLSATFSEITETGNLVKSNERFNIIVVDKDIQSYIDAINKFLTERIPN